MRNHINKLRNLKRSVKNQIHTLYHAKIITPRNIETNKNKIKRYLEIGPGEKKLDDFEALNIVASPGVDYVCDVTKRLPFKNNSFDVIYASHVLEHLPWFQSEEILKEWIRILKPGGQLEIWVPDGELICEIILDHSRNIPNGKFKDGWTRENPKENPFLWAQGRLFYGLNNNYPSWHKAVFTETSLKNIFHELGLQNIRRTNEEEYRGGANHGIINLGVFGEKK